MSTTTSSPSHPTPSPIPLRGGSPQSNDPTTSPIPTSNDEKHASLPHPKLPTLNPKPTLRLHLNDLYHPIIPLVLNSIDASNLLSDAVNATLKYLYSHPPKSTTTTVSSSSSPSKEHHHHHAPHIPPTRSITLILRTMDGVAYTTGLDLDDAHKEIHLNLSYLASVSSSSSSKTQRLHTEILGVTTHEVVHCYQHNALGSAPSGLIEGIADFVRLKAGLAPPHWKSAKEERGEKWDQGYQHTAYFLEWVQSRFGEGSVEGINEALRGKEYEEEKLWKGLFGMGVQGLWEEYGRSLSEEEEDGMVVVEKEEEVEEEGGDGKTGHDREGPDGKEGPSYLV